MSDINTITFKLTPSDGYHYDNNGLDLLVKLVKDNAKKYEIRDKPNPHAALIAQCEQDKIDYPDFYEQLYQFKSPNGWETLDKLFNAHFMPQIAHRVHTHRARIIEFHQCSGEDKLRWECKKIGVPLAMWCQTGHSGVMEWREDYEYRIRPKVCKVTLQDGTVLEYPEPVRDELNFGQSYYLINISDCKIEERVWNGECYEYFWLKYGLIHIDSDLAQQHFDVMQAVNAQTAI